MVTVNQGLNLYRDRIRDAIAKVVIGTGTTPESVADTALQNQVAEKDATTFDAGTGEFVARGRLLTTENNGQVLTEVGLKSGSTVTERRTHAALTKTSLIEVEYEILVRLRNKT
ncbi:MAG: hypothetical protein QMD46_12320 [Methanomicrobiales archaeon]|nr:hypothetical protein [Methanomicrobiales archaeon]MDI6877535.1 hypothetical protein [Methanomicrobiales archaeon]